MERSLPFSDRLVSDYRYSETVLAILWCDLPRRFFRMLLCETSRQAAVLDLSPERRQRGHREGTQLAGAIPSHREQRPPRHAPPCHAGLASSRPVGLATLHVPTPAAFLVYGSRGSVLSGGFAWDARWGTAIGASAACACARCASTLGETLAAYCLTRGRRRPRGRHNRAGAAAWW